MSCKDYCHNYIRFFTLNMILKIILAWAFLLFCSIPGATGQKIDFGLPFIHNFDRHAYNGGTQTWEIITAKNNRILAANNEGLLQFDGHKWEKYSLPNKTILRSIAYDMVTQKIYAGGQDELGYFQPDESGVLMYTDLRQTIPATFNNLEDVWNLKLANGSLYFRSMNRIFAFDGRQWKTIGTTETSCLAQVGNVLVFNDTDKGLFKIEGEKTSFVEGSDILKNKTITGIFDLKHEWVVCTEKDGILKLKDNKWEIINSAESTFLKTNRIHSACKINDTLLAIGTYLNGIIFLDHQGKIHGSYNKNKGLQNNTVASLHFSSNHQLWAGTYNGIDMIEMAGLFTNIYPDGSLQGAVFAATIYKQKLYCGTENGLYYRDLATKSPMETDAGFQVVKGTEGQVWGLDIIFGNLIMSHNDGAFLIESNKATKISKYNGSWKFIEFGDNNFCLGGAYSGLYVFRKIGAVWQEIGKISGFDESCRIMTKDSKYLWISHPYRGLFRLEINLEKLSANIENYGQKSGLPGYLRNTVHNIENQILVTTELGTYKFDNAGNKFVRVDLPGMPAYAKVHYKALAEEEGKLWLATNQHFGYIKYDQKLYSSKRYETNLFDFENLLVPGFEKIFPVEKAGVLLLTTKGLKYFQDGNKVNSNLGVYISKVFDVSKNLIVSDGFENDSLRNTTTKTFDHDSNGFLFDFATTSCNKSVKFRYLLSPSQKEWSPWDHKSQKEFNNLFPDDYTLSVEASDVYGHVSPVFDYTFKIKSPWYRSVPAILMYLLAGLFLIIFSRQRLVKKYEHITTNLEEQKTENEALILQLQKEKLETEMHFKDKELGLSSMHLVQKTEAISKLKKELSKIAKKINDPELKKEVRSIASILSDDERLDEDWESFAQNFDSVHNDFLNRLKTRFPALSTSDLKLCAYLRQNMTTKDIAPLLNISVRGVEISRYRLRKKMDLSFDVNLNDFMRGM